VSDEILDLEPLEGQRGLVRPDGETVRMIDALREPFVIGLAENRVTIFNRRRQPLTHVFAPVTEADWIEFERLTRLVLEHEDQRLKADSMSAAAVNWLWGERILRVEGYGELPEDWKDRVWLKDKQKAIAALTQIFEWYDAPEDSLAMDETTIYLEAQLNGAVYQGMRHVFRRVTTKQQIEYSRVTGQATMMRGQRGGYNRSITPTHLGYQLRLWDQLSVKVEGYEPNDPKQVDAMHKKVAIEALMGNG
jgi:hypothetical protein